MKSLAIVVLSVLIGVAGALTARAQAITTIYSFSSINGPMSPAANLALGPDGNFYGTTYRGGSTGAGTVFQVTTNGTLTTLVNFGGANGDSPEAGLTLGPDDNFYGTTYGDGGGTVFQMTTNGVLTTRPTSTTPTDRILSRV